MGRLSATIRWKSISAALLLAAFGTTPAHAEGGAGSAAVPDTLRVEKTVILMRHGARSGVATRDIRAYSALTYPDFGCADGQLTAHGRAGMVLWGQYHRRRLERLGQLTPNVPLTNAHVYVATGPLPRSRDSAEAFLQGLSPRNSVMFAAENTRPWFIPAGEGLIQAEPERVRNAVEQALGMSLARAQQHYQRDLAAAETSMGVRFNRLSTMPWRLEFDRGGLHLMPLELIDTMAETFRMQYVNGLPISQVAFGSGENAVALSRLMALRTLHRDVIRHPRYLAVRQGWPLLAQMFDSLAAGYNGLDDSRVALSVYVGHEANVAAVRAIIGFDWQMPEGLHNDPAPGGMLMLERVRDVVTQHRFVRVSYHAQTSDQIRHLVPLGAEAPFETTFVPPAAWLSPGRNLIPWETFQNVVGATLGDAFEAPPSAAGGLTLGGHLRPGALAVGPQDHFDAGPFGAAAAAAAGPAAYLLVPPVSPGPMPFL